MRQLILFRHAKTHPARPGQEDHDRALTPRGWDDAPRVARALATRGIRPDLVLYSDARRCCETMEAVSEVFGGVPIQKLSSLYLAEEDTLLNLIQEKDARCLMIIAHNPGIHMLATHLSPMGDSGARMRQHYPTSAAACFEKDDTAEDDWKLLTFITPKEVRPVEQQD